MNKFELIDAVENSNIDEKKRTELVNLLKRYTPYGLHYEPKAEAAAEQLATHLPVLNELAERQVEAPPLEGLTNNAPLLGGVGGGLIDHLLIEGENLHVLTAMQYTHYQKVDVIYIDPPYNTGNKDFRYNDKYVDKEDAYRHTQWLSFMERRLRLAKNLLKDTGVIFISIDDNEQAQLKLLCDKIFGEGNFICNFIWEARSGKSGTIKKISNQHEFILCYCKNQDEVKIKLNSIVKQSGNFLDEKGYYSREHLRQWGQGDKREDRPSMYFPIIYNDIEIYPRRKDGSDGRWRVGKEKIKKLQEIGDLDFVYDETENNWIVYKKIRVGRVTETSIDSIFRNVGTSSNGTIELKDIFNDKVFDTTKPLNLIKKILVVSDINPQNENFTVLDFFAGSGTTAQATMELNAQDGGKRQCILVTNNENGIAEQVCYERVKRVIQGYTNSKGNYVDGLPGNRLRYFKSEPFELKPGTKSREMLTKQLAGLLCMREACYNAIPVHIARNDKTVPPNILSQYANDDDSKRLFILYDESEIDDCLFYLDELVCSAIDGLRAMPKIFVYVYSPSDYPYTEDFDVLNEYITLKAIPDLILRALR